MSLDDSGIRGRREFPTTSWSLIVQAGDSTSPDFERHLGRLVEQYWKPVFCVIRQAWARTDDAAKDLTQEFFATVVFDRNLVSAYAPERGSFRTLLRTAIQRFMHDTARRAGTQKRGGGKVLPLEEMDRAAVEAIPGADQLTPEQIFDLAWNQTVITKALGILERTLRADGHAVMFEVFRRYDVDGDSAELSYTALGREFGLSPDQVKRQLGQARAIFRDIVTDLVREYVDGTDELARELRSLFGV